MEKEGIIIESINKKGIDGNVFLVSHKREKSKVTIMVSGTYESIFGDQVNFYSIFKYAILGGFKTIKKYSYGCFFE